MAFADEQVKAAGAKLYYIVKLELDSADTYYALPAHHGASANYSGRLMAADGLSRRVDIIGGDVLTEEAKIILQDNDETVSELLSNEAIVGKVGTVQIGFKDSAGTMYTDDIFSGTLERRESSTTEVQIAIIPKIREDMGIIQRSITESSFPNAPGSTLGQGLNIVLGDVDSDTRGNGAVYCPIVDTTNHYVAVAGHACKLADNFIKVKGDTITNITPSAISYTATDGDSNTYTRATIAGGDWDADALYYCDCQGLETNGDGTGSVIYNPSTLIQAVIEDFSNLSSADIDAASFTAWATTMTARGYDTAGEWGGVIPWNAGEVIEDPISILSQLAFNCGGVIYITGSGTVGIIDADISTTESSTGSLTVIDEKDLTSRNANISRAPFTILNKTRGGYRWAHRIQSGEKYIIAEDQGSVANYGETKEDETLLYYVRGTDTVEDLLERYLLKRGGNPQFIEMPICGLHKHGVEVGDTVLFTHDHIGAGLSNKQVKITGVDIYVPRMSGSASVYGHEFETFTGVTRGDVFGPVSFSGQEATAFTATLDTRVDYSSAGTSYGSETTVRHGGENEAEWEISGNLVRAAYRFDISSIGGASTIVSASLKVYVTQSFSTSQFHLRQLGETTWGESSTWNNFTSNGAGTAWTDTYIGGTSLSDDTAAVTSGYKTWVLNSSGISYLQGLLAGTGLAQFTHQQMNRNERYDIASSEHATAAFRPTLTVTYTT